MRSLLALLFLTPLAAHAAPVATVTGSCPGTLSVHTTGLTPGGSYAIATANVPGLALVPAGSCAGTPTELGPFGAALRGVYAADGLGAGNVSAPVPASLCGRYVEVLDLSACATSGSQRLPRLLVDHYEAVLSGDQVVPPVVTTAFGLLTASVETGTMAWDLTASSFFDPLSGGHFHVGFPGENGPAVRSITGHLVQVGSEVSGSFTWAMSASERQALADGQMYVDVTSFGYGQEELRGQLLARYPLTGELHGLQAVPPVSSGATGLVTVVLDDTDTLTWVLDASGLGSVTGAHIHQGAAGTTGPVLWDLGPDLTQVGDALTGGGTWRMSGLDAASLLAGDLYVNIHTAANPGGEIRAQLLLD